MGGVSLYSRVCWILETVVLKNTASSGRHFGAEVSYWYTRKVFSHFCVWRYSEKGWSPIDSRFCDSSFVGTLPLHATLPTARTLQSLHPWKKNPNFTKLHFAWNCHYWRLRQEGIGTVKKKSEPFTNEKENRSLGPHCPYSMPSFSFLNGILPQRWHGAVSTKVVWSYQFYKILLLTFTMKMAQKSPWGNKWLQEQ